MPTLNIEGRRVRVDDSFLKLSPEQQQATVDEIAGSLGVGAAKAPEASPEPPQPEERGIFRRVDDAVRGAADMLTFGFADEIAAGAGSATGIGGQAGEYDANLAAQRQRDSEGGWERFGGQMAGAFAMPSAMARTTMKAAGQGALVGGAYGFGSGEGGIEERAKSAALGGLTGGAVGGGLRGLTNSFANSAARNAIPNNEMIRRSAEAAYKAADDAGVIIRPESTKRLASQVVNDLAEFGFDPALQPGVGAVINRLQALDGQNVTLKGLDIIRRVAGSAAQQGDNPSQRALAARIIDRIDEHIADLKPTDVLGGNSREAANSMLQARSLWSRLRKSEMVDTAALKAERRAASTGSGGNADNALRQNVRGILDNPKKARGLTALEKSAAERVVRGTRGQNAMRLAGKLSPQGNGLMAALGIGGAMTNPVLGIPSLVGLGAKALADRSTVKNAERLSEIIRSGGQGAKEMVAAAMRGEGPPELVAAIQQLLTKDATARGAAVPLSAMAAEKVRAY